MIAVLSSYPILESGTKCCNCFLQTKSYVQECYALLDSFCFKSDIFPFQISHNANDTHVMVYGYSTIFLQVVYDFIQMFGIVNRHRYTYFRGTNHIDGCLVAFENFEYFTQETVSQ